MCNYLCLNYENHFWQVPLSTKFFNFRNVYSGEFPKFKSGTNGGGKILTHLLIHSFHFLVFRLSYLHYCWEQRNEKNKKKKVGWKAFVNTMGSMEPIWNINFSSFAWLQIVLQRFIRAIIWKIFFLYHIEGDSTLVPQIAIFRDWSKHRWRQRL